MFSKIIFTVLLVILTAPGAKSSSEDKGDSAGWKRNNLFYFFRGSNQLDIRGDDNTVNICRQEVDSGVCKAYMPRFYFNTASNKCERFIYGGCGGNGNNFRTLKDCVSFCGGDQLPETINNSHRDVADVFEMGAGTTMVTTSPDNNGGEKGPSANSKNARK